MNRKSISVLFLGFLVSSSSAFAMRGEMGILDRSDRSPAVQPEIVKWIGEVKDEAATHTAGHEHELKFVKKDDGKEYGIKDSPDLVKLHHETERNFIVEIEAEKTPRFLFWGGNLIVRNFKVLEETDSVPHLTEITQEPVRVREFRERP